MKVDLIAAGTRMTEAGELARQVKAGGWSGIAFAEGGRTAYLSCGAAALAVPDLDYTTAVALAFPRLWVLGDKFDLIQQQVVISVCLLFRPGFICIKPNVFEISRGFFTKFIFHCL